MASPTAVTFATMAVASLAPINVRSSLIMSRGRSREIGDQDTPPQP